MNGNTSIYKRKYTDHLLRLPDFFYKVNPRQLGLRPQNQHAWSGISRLDMGTRPVGCFKYYLPINFKA